MLARQRYILKPGASTCYQTALRVLSRCARGLNTAPKGPARTRFAPSPTGYLHLGSLRTALYNYLYAVGTGGQFVLRIEDTDKKRTVDDAEQHICDELRRFGLKWHEGPYVGGPYGPYTQSQRLHLYRDYGNRLLNTGQAYRCFCTKKRLDQLAQHRKGLGLPSDYDRVCASISREKSDERAAEGESYVIRLLAPEFYPTFHDNVYGVVGREQKGHLRFRADMRSTAGHEDPVLLKSDGWPTYHFANVVDDHFMEITHVIRGTEWLSSTPKHLAIYNAFGWEPPNYAHISLLVDKEGQKLSKRNNDMDIMKHLQQGFLPDAMINFVALLGWSHSSTTDVMELGQLVGEVSRRFSAGRDMAFTKGNAIVDPGKLVYLNTAHSRRVTLDYLQNPCGDHKTLDAMIHQVMQCLPDILPDIYGDQKGKPNAQWQAKLPVPLKLDLSEYVRQLLLCAAGNYKTPGDFSYRLRYFFSDVPFERDDELAKPSTRRHIMQSFQMKSVQIADAAHVKMKTLHFALASLFQTLDETDAWNSGDIITDTISSISRTLSRHLGSSPPPSALNSAFATMFNESKGSTEYNRASSTISNTESAHRPNKSEKSCRKSLCAYARLILMDGLNGPGIHTTIALLGRQVCMRRFEAATALLQSADASSVDLLGTTSPSEERVDSNTAINACDASQSK